MEAVMEQLWLASSRLENDILVHFPASELESNHDIKNVMAAQKRARDAQESIWDTADGFLTEEGKPNNGDKNSDILDEYLDLFHIGQLPFAKTFKLGSEITKVETAVSEFELLANKLQTISLAYRPDEARKQARNEIRKGMRSGKTLSKLVKEYADRNKRIQKLRSDAYSDLKNAEVDFGVTRAKLKDADTLEKENTAFAYVWEIGTPSFNKAPEHIGRGLFKLEAGGRRGRSASQAPTDIRTQPPEVFGSYRAGPS
jgi:phage-related minor tail protein